MDGSCKKNIIDALNEDLQPNGDITSDCLIEQKHISTFQLIVNEDAIVAGLDVFNEVFFLLDKDIKIKLHVNDGDEIKKDTVVSDIAGNTLAILKAERTALNFLCHLSGISTNTRRFVDLIKGTGVILLDTRKTTPNLRIFEKKAILLGGAKNHRFNLGEMILIKDNHIAALGGVSKAFLKAKEFYGKKFRIEVEIQSLDQLKEIIPYAPDIIMFDNWTASDLKNALKLLPGDILTEASGQITVDNILDYACTGVKYISTSYMIKNFKWIDFSLNAV